MTHLQSTTHLDKIIDRLENSTGEDLILDSDIYQIIIKDKFIVDRLQLKVSESIPKFTSTLESMILIPRGWWWHIGHLGVNVVPNAPDKQIPISNAIDYLMNGRPIEYKSWLWADEREKIPRAIAAAALKAHRALFLKSLAIKNNRMYLTQTGNGPRLVCVDGRIVELPYQSWLDEDGKLVARNTSLDSKAPIPEIIEDEDEL